MELGWGRAGLDGGGGEGVLLGGVIEARWTNLALLFGGESLEESEMGMWFGPELAGEFSKTGKQTGAKLRTASTLAAADACV